MHLTSLVGVSVRRLKIIGWKCWNDGIDLVSVQDAIVEQSFIRSDDDAIAIKGMDAAVDTLNISVSHSTLFNQAHGNCMEIGYELWNQRVEGITFDSNVCIHQVGSVMSIHNGGRAVVSGVSYRNIVVQGLYWPEYEGGRVEHDPTWGLKLIEARIAYGQFCRPSNGCHDPNERGTISGLNYTNVTYNSNGVRWLKSRLLGNSSSHPVEGLAFDTVSIGGIPVEKLVSQTQAAFSPFL